MSFDSLFDYSGAIKYLNARIIEVDNHLNWIDRKIYSIQQGGNVVNLNLQNERILNLTAIKRIENENANSYSFLLDKISAVRNFASSDKSNIYNFLQECSVEDKLFSKANVMSLMMAYPDKFISDMANISSAIISGNIAGNTSGPLASIIYQNYLPPSGNVLALLPYFDSPTYIPKVTANTLLEIGIASNAFPQILANKTLVSPIIESATLRSPILSNISIDNNGVITFPNTTDTLIGRNSTDTLTNKTLISATLITPAIATIKNTGTLTLPTITDTLVGRTTTDTLTNKTLTSPTITSPVISSIHNTGTLTLPTSTDTLVGRNTTDTLTNKSLTNPIMSSINNGGTVTIPSGTITLVGNSSVQILTNKTLTSPTITSPVISTIVNTGTLTLPTSTDTLVGRNTTDTLTNKSITNPIMSSINNGGTVTIPSGTITLVGNSNVQTLTNKTLTSPTITSPVISTIVNTGTLTLPTSTDTLVGRNTTDTLTNKTLTSPTITSPVISTIVNTGTLTLPTSTDTLVGRNTTDTLTNKTLTSPTITLPTITSINNGGTITIPTGASTLVGTTNTQTLTNKTIDSTTNMVTADKLRSATTTITISSSQAPITGQVLTAIDSTNASWQNPSAGPGSGITTLNGLTVTTQSFSIGTGGTNFNISSSGSTHTFNIPDASASNRGLVTTGAQTFAGVKTFSNSPVISSITNSGTLTLPTSTDTLVGRSTTDTLSNKTINTTSSNIVARALWTGSTAVSTYAASAPSTGQILTATSGTLATWQNPVTNTFYETDIISSTTLTSTIYAILSGMYLTPAQGTYNISFNGSFTTSASSTTTAALVLGIGPSSFVSTSSSSTSNIVTVNFASQAIVTGGTGGVSSTILVVTGVTSGSMAVGQIISGTGISPGTFIVANLMGNGGIGSYTLSSPNSIADGTTITAGSRGYMVGQPIIVTGFTPSAFNGQYVITNLTPVSLQYSLVVADQTASVQGAISPGGYMSVASGSASGNNITLTMNGNPQIEGFIVGQQIIVSGFAPTSYNGTWTLTAVTSNSISYTASGVGSASATTIGSVGFIVPGTPRNVMLTTTSSPVITINKVFSLTGAIPVAIYVNSTTGTLTCKSAIFNMTRFV